MPQEIMIFFYFIITGVGIGVLFDFFRILRKIVKTNSIIVYIEDILFCIISGLIMLVICFITNDGKIRGFMFIGAIIGAVLYFLTISKFIVKTFAFIIGLVIKLITKIVLIILRGIKKCLRLERLQRKIHKRKAKKQRSQ